MPMPQLILSIDSALGRPDIAFLTDQMRMELLFLSLVEQKEEVPETPRIRNTEGDFEDIQSWYGVRCDDADTSRVISIDWSSKDWLHGVKEFDFSQVPRTLEELELSYNKFQSTVNLSDLPDTLLEFYINDNQFFGKTNTACPSG